jgi:hypothetical protein
MLKSTSYSDDADNLRHDSNGDHIWVGYGGGALGEFDQEGTKLADIKLDAHPEPFQLVRRQLLFPVVLPHLEMLPKVWKHFWSNFDLADGVKQSTGRSFMQHTEAGWRSGGGLCWRTTRQGKANWRLIHGDGRRHAAEDRASIAWIDFRMPRKTHGYCRRAAASSHRAGPEARAGMKAPASTSVLR